MDRSALSKLTVVKLRQLLTSNDLDTVGKKDDLIDRLIANKISADSFEEAPTRKSTRQTKTAKKSTAAKRSKAKAPDSDSESDSEPKAPVTKAKKAKATTSKKTKTLKPSEDSSESSEEVKSTTKAKKASSTTKKGSSRKKRSIDDVEEGSEEEELSHDVVKRKKVDSNATRQVDANLGISGSVHFDPQLGFYDVMLNFTDITSGNNNNKFYVLQLVNNSGTYCLGVRYGRVGEVGKTSLKYFNTVKAGVDAFHKQYRSKTMNDFASPVFKRVPGKYMLMEKKDENEDAKKPKSLAPVKKNNVVSKLPQSVIDLLTILFDHDMFKSQMQTYDINVDEMPLGAISVEQVEKGRKILSKISDVLQGTEKGGRAALETYTSQFYTIIPHAFSRGTRPTILDNAELVQKKFDLCNFLVDVEAAQSILEIDTPETVNIHDLRLKELNCKVDPLDKSSKEFQVIQAYFNATKNKGTIMEVFDLDREAEGKRFSVNDDIEERKLLWHGTNVAVVVAILKSGLRIMPHSGGRVGKGIYFASMCQKSASYVSCTNQNIGFMFLTEVAIGKQHVITADDSSLKKAPNGYDSVLAKGRLEPDSSLDTHLEFEGKKVIVPQGKGKAFAQSSSFHHSEYLVYNEHQARLRYLLKINFGKGGWF